MPYICDGHFVLNHNLFVHVRRAPISARSYTPSTGPSTGIAIKLTALKKTKLFSDLLLKTCQKKQQTWRPFWNYELKVGTKALIPAFFPFTGASNGMSPV
jgi:hypothetical protein